MWTGTSALKNLDQSLQTIRNEVVRLDSQLQQLTDSLAVNQRHRVKLINDIATVRLVEIEQGDLQARLTAADQQAVEILQQRESALASVNQAIDELNQQIAEAETQRGALLERVNNTSQKIVDVEASVQQALKQDEVYLAQFSKAQLAESVSAEAERKVEQAQADMAEKAAPYKDDALFIYLWERGFGTTEYNGGLFSRFMDSWVARLIGYEESRINYWNLTEIPKRLTEHADSVGDAADQEHMTLQQLELDALEQAGRPSLEVELEALRADLDSHDDSLEELEEQLNSQLSERARFVAGEDEYIQRCLSRLTQAMDHENLQAVHRYVRETVSPTDDQLVIELQNLDARLADTRGDLNDVRTLHGRRLNKLKDLEKVRRDFKNARYDDVRSGFGNETLIASVLGQFLQGVVSGADLWRVLQRNQRYRDIGSMPDFGSGGLGELGDILGGGTLGRRGRTRRSKRRGSSWHWPKPRGGGGGFRLPRGGGRSSGGGGFTTGGRF